MEELSIEEKAKRYDEILARATGAYLPYYTEDIMTKVREFVEYLLPELKESEGESIRKRLIELLKKNDERHFAKEIAWLEKQGDHANFINKIQIGDKVTHNEDGVLVNLSQLNRVAKKDEKQGEQKPADTVEPKFREGDSIQFNGVGHNRYKIREVCGLSHYINTMGKRMDMSYTDAANPNDSEFYVEVKLIAKECEL